MCTGLVSAGQGQPIKARQLVGLGEEVTQDKWTLLLRRLIWEVLSIG